MYVRIYTFCVQLVYNFRLGGWMGSLWSLYMYQVYILHGTPNFLNNEAARIKSVHPRCWEQLPAHFYQRRALCMQIGQHYEQHNMLKRLQTINPAKALHVVR
jgi:hypothetical protein